MAALDEKMMAMALRMQTLDIPDHIIEDLIGVRPAPAQVDDDDEDREETTSAEDAETISV